MIVGTERPQKFRPIENSQLLLFVYQRWPGVIQNSEESTQAPEPKENEDVFRIVHGKIYQ